jgi:hypothetical protein
MRAIIELKRECAGQVNLTTDRLKYKKNKRLKKFLAISERKFNIEYLLKNVCISHKA